MIAPLRGISGLLSSRNGVIALIVLGVCSYLNYHGTLDSLGYTAMGGVISTIYMYTRARPVKGQSNEPA
jgi:hypothetical protein